MPKTPFVMTAGCSRISVKTIHKPELAKYAEQRKVIIMSEIWISPGKPMAYCVVSFRKKESAAQTIRKTKSSTS